MIAIVKEFDPRDFYRDIGLHLRKERLRAGFSQDKLAEAMNLTRGSIANIESGRQSLSLHGLYLAAKTLDLPLCTLLNGQHEPVDGEGHTCGRMGGVVIGPDSVGVHLANINCFGDTHGGSRCVDDGDKHPLRAENSIQLRP